MTRERVYRLLPLLVALTTLAVFLPAVHNDFVDFDDSANFLENPSYRGLDWTHLRWMWTSQFAGHYIPITWMTLGLDYKIWGMNAAGYHFTNIVWHAANAAVFFLLALALYRRAKRGGTEEVRDQVSPARSWIAALVASLVFAIHPLRVESVVWITERRDVVSGLFFLLAILVYVNGVQATGGHAIARRNYWGSFALFVGAVLSKEMAVTLPAVLLILDVYPLGRVGEGGRWSLAAIRQICVEKIPFVAVSIADSALIFWASHQLGLSEMVHTSGFDRVAISMYGLAFYLRKTLWPSDLIPFYDITRQRLDPFGAPFLFSLAAVVIAAAIVFALRRKWTVLVAAALAYFVILIPVIGIFQNGGQIAADRYSYLACLGWALALGAVFLKWKVEKHVWMGGIAGAVMMVLAVLTWRQVQIWRDPDTLWSAALKVEPSFVAHLSMGNAFLAQGDNLWAVEHLRQAISFRPDLPVAHRNLGLALIGLGRLDEAIEQFQIVRQMGINPAVAENDLAGVLQRQGKLAEAVRHYREALRLNPKYDLARRNLEAINADPEKAK